MPGTLDFSSMLISYWPKKETSNYAMFLIFVPGSLSLKGLENYNRSG
jgi:hypothetical protein